jgi:hypothetical protein
MLLSFYKTSSDDGFAIENTEAGFASSPYAILRKYKIKNKLSMNEKNEISSALKMGHTLTPSKQAYMQDKSNVRLVNPHSLFDNLGEAFGQIKTNKQIFDTINTISSEEKKSRYLESYHQALNDRLKVLRMPDVYISPLQIAQIAIKKEDMTKKTNSFVRRIGMSTDALIRSCLEMSAKKYDTTGSKPKSRCQALYQ